MRPRGVIIPGLAMAARELPPIDGVVALDNPEIGGGVALGRDYALEEVAELHARTIAELAPRGEPFVVAGMSMGGMITAVLASTLRSKLPARCSFHFFVTTPNLPENPAITDATVAGWATARRGSTEDFARILAPFFSPSFLARHAAVAQSYYAYRANGESGQTARAFFRQMNALRACPAHEHFARVDPVTASFLGGADDRVLGPSHDADLRRLCPGARHAELAELGHMINLERPDLLHSAFDT